MIPDKIRGKVFVVGDDIDTDVIIPARFITTMDPKLLAAHAMEDLDPRKYPIPFLNPDKSCDYEIIVAGKNFGCGSSREHAPIALNAAGIKAVASRSFARIYYRNSINGGRNIIPLETYEDLSIVTKTGQELEINLYAEMIINLTNNRTYKIKPFGPVIEILEAGGLTLYNKRKLNL